MHRPHELGAIRTLLDRPEPSLIHVTGPRGVGKTTLVRTAVEGVRALLHRVPPVPEPGQRAALAAQVAGTFGPLEPDASATPGGPRPSRTPGASGAPGAPGAPGSPEGDWEALFRHLLSTAADGHPLVLVLDDAHRLGEARARAGAPLARVLAEAHERSIPFHVILVGAAGALPDVSLPRRPATPPEPVPVPVEVGVRPLPLRGALPWLPGTQPEDRIRAYAVFGGIPGHLRLLDPGSTLWTNIRRTVLDPGSPLADRGLEILERDLQVPARYVAVLTALAGGEADWGAVHEGVPDLTTSGQVAPYLRRLEELGLVEVRRSLDAGPRSRNRRYRIADPFLAFWFRFILPFRHAYPEPDPGTWINTVIRPALDEHVAGVLPELCRRHMALDAMEWVGSNAREEGSLWGPGYDIPVAGMLASGMAFYGKSVWGGDPARIDVLETLDAMVGETRYGFGRERRLRIVFATGGFDPELTRQAARRDNVSLVDAATLVGSEDDGE